MKDYLDTKDEVFVLEEKFLQDGPTNKDIVQKFNALRTHAKRYREARDENKASLEKVKGALASSADAFAEEKLRTTCAEEQFAAESQEKEDLLEQVQDLREQLARHDTQRNDNSLAKTRLQSRGPSIERRDNHHSRIRTLSPQSVNSCLDDDAILASTPAAHQKAPMPHERHDAERVVPSVEQRHTRFEQQAAAAPGNYSAFGCFGTYASPDQPDPYKHRANAAHQHTPVSSLSAPSYKMEAPFKDDGLDKEKFQSGPRSWTSSSPLASSPTSPKKRK